MLGLDGREPACVPSCMDQSARSRMVARQSGQPHVPTSAAAIPRAIAVSAEESAASGMTSGVWSFAIAASPLRVDNSGMPATSFPFRRATHTTASGPRPKADHHAESHSGRIKG
jgi:hypothetical protein